MAESALRKALIKKFQLPSTRKGFIDEFDGNVDGLSRLQMDIDSSGDEAAIQLFQDAVDNSGGTDSGIVDELVNILYPQKTGARGKTAPVPERVESNLPTSNADQGTLDATPYESLSNTDRTKLTAAGFPSADVSTWSAEDLRATLDSIDGTRQTGGKKATAGKTAAKATPAAGNTAAKEAPAAAPPGPVPATSVADVMPSREAVFSTSTDPADFLSAAQAGQTPDSELDRVLNMPPAPDRPAVQQPLPDAPLPEPMQFDQIGMMANASPPPSPLRELLANAGPPATEAVDVPPAMDMSLLSGLPSLRDLFPPAPARNPWSTTAGMPPDPIPLQRSIDANNALLEKQARPTAVTEEKGFAERALPITSRANQFWKSRPFGDTDLGKTAADVGSVATWPLSLTADAALWGGAAAAGLGVGAAGLKGARYLMGGDQSAPEDELLYLQEQRDAARAEAEQAFGGFMEDARQYTQPAQKPVMPKGRSL